MRHIPEFKKRNPLPGSNSLIVEEHGLHLLAQAIRPGFSVPKVISLTRDELVLEKIEHHAPNDEEIRQFARHLAHMHDILGTQFGLDRDNYIGLNPQKNILSNDWGRFFVDRRLRAQIAMVKSSLLREALAQSLSSIEARLIDFLNAHQPQPSLLHGDLWHGNVLFARESIYLIDPAVYYGDREADLAMSELFGGFGSHFIAEYQRHYALPKGFERRFEIYNLYHLLNHYNLFGSTYEGAVKKGFERLLRGQSLPPP